MLLTKMTVSVRDKGCLSRIRIFSIPDPGSRVKKNFLIRIRIKEFKYFNVKIVPGVKKAPDPDTDPQHWLLCSFY
jgi:hypothetical protein